MRTKEVALFFNKWDWDITGLDPDRAELYEYVVNAFRKEATTLLLTTLDAYILTDELGNDDKAFSRSSEEITPSTFSFATRNRRPRAKSICQIWIGRDFVSHEPIGILPNALARKYQTCKTNWLTVTNSHLAVGGKLVVSLNICLFFSTHVNKTRALIGVRHGFFLGFVSVRYNDKQEHMSSQQRSDLPHPKRTENPRYVYRLASVSIFKSR